MHLVIGRFGGKGAMAPQDEQTLENYSKNRLKIGYKYGGIPLLVSFPQSITARMLVRNNLLGGKNSVMTKKRSSSFLGLNLAPPAQIPGSAYASSTINLVKSRNVKVQVLKNFAFMPGFML